ncbi:MAG: hypothetical protein U9N63_14145, partial [Pseudomonadota bacterium]|nr:hypothetical protein [Pseudomonadota bacterium]
SKKTDTFALQQQLSEHYHLILLIKFLFRGLQVNLGVVLLVIVLPLKLVPVWLGFLAWGGLAFLFIVRSFRPGQSGVALRWILYLIVPTLVYLGEQAHGYFGYSWINRSWVEIACNLSFLSLVIFSLLVLRFTRRAGYRSTPLDFLILIVAIIVPLVIPQNLVEVPVGLVVAKVIVIFFAFEVVIEESRGPVRWLELMVGLLLFILGVKRCEQWFPNLIN